MAKQCIHVEEICSIYDGGVALIRSDDSVKDIDYAGYKCKFCPECGEKTKWGKIAEKKKV